MKTVADQIRLDNVTKGLPPSYQNRLLGLSPKNISVISSYISALRSELKLSDNYRQNILNTLIGLSKSSKRSFRDFTRQDTIKYLDQFRKNDYQDPLHKWIGTYNAHLVNIVKFFRWLYSPKLEPKKRPKPKVVQNLPKLRRLEISGYKPADMWGPEDNLLFLKYCPSPRDKCYHAMEVDIGARPHELLNLRIKDVEYKEEGGIRYAEIMVNGKTGQRVLPLIDSLPYVTQWISLHPQGTNREAPIFPSENTGKMIKVNAMSKAYEKYKKYFQSLLLSKNVVESDKKKIGELLKKRWNIYTYRHSSLTEKSNILSDNQLRQFAGWTSRSQMHYKYVHFSGGEATKNLLKAKGIIKGDKQSVNILQPKICPSCGESNKPGAQFCYKCNFVMSLELYQKGVEEKQAKDQKIEKLTQQTRKMYDMMTRLAQEVRMYKNDAMAYREQFGPRRLTKVEQEKVAYFIKMLDSMPKDDSVEVEED